MNPTTKGPIQILREAMIRLLASDPNVAACSDDDLREAINDEDAPPLVKEQGAALLQARESIASTEGAEYAGPNAYNRKLMAQLDQEWVDLRCMKDAYKAAPRSHRCHQIPEGFCTCTDAEATKCAAPVMGAPAAYRNHAPGIPQGDEA